MVGRLLVPIGILILVIGGTLWIISLFSNSRKRKRAMQAAIDAVIYPQESKVHISLYMNMVAKHGPDSEEAKAFRFGTGGRLFSNNAIQDAFEQQANIIDDTYRKMKAMQGNARR